MEMVHFISAYSKLGPLYWFIALGFIAGKMKVDGQSIANILTFILTPTLFFHVGLTTECELYYLSLPVLSFLLSSLLCGLYLLFCKRIWEGKIKNLLAFGAGASNSGYFGLPVMIMFFPSEIVSVYMLIILGVAIFDYTLGAYIMARGNYSAKASIIKVLTLPIMHAFAAGMILKRLDFTLPHVMMSIFENTQGCYVVLGLMLIGISLSRIANLKINWLFVVMLLSARFVVSPILTYLLVFLDTKFWHLYPPSVACPLIMLAFMPPAVNTVIFATMYNNHYEEAAVSVILGIVIAMILFPFILYTLQIDP